MSGSSTRDSWSTRRDRKRLHTRYVVDQRMVSGKAVIANEREEQAAQEELNIDWIHRMLYAIVEDNRSFFSIGFVNENLYVLTQPLPVVPCFLCRNGNLQVRQKILSRLGFPKTEKLEEMMQCQSHCTMTEYMAKLKRPFLLQALIQGGVQPANSLQGAAFARHCFDHQVPPSLSAYVVQRVMDMRVAPMEYDDDQDEKLEECFRCKKGLTSFEQRTLCDKCNVAMCESCVWEHAMNKLQDFYTRDVMMCALCQKSDLSLSIQRPVGASPLDKFRESRDKFASLPVDSAALKRLPRAKTKKNKGLSSGWSDALALSVGSSQNVRKDRFWKSIESGSYPHAAACLKAGMDLSQRNEYGHSPLFLAAWLGQQELTELLVGFGCDVNATANDGCTVLQAARHVLHAGIIQFLVENGAEERACPPPFDLNTAIDAGRGTSLVGVNLSCAGAGSFMVDNIIPEALVEFLLCLHDRLPVAEDTKTQKGTPCSVRRYYCDVGNLIIRHIKFHLDRCGNVTSPSDIVVFPHLRFLQYNESGAFLGKHVDLSRCHPFSGGRSTHSFLLYLTTCSSGGETVLQHDMASGQVMAKVAPRKARLVVFPHLCPHSGAEVIDVPKTLIRGEIILPQCFNLMQS